MSGVMICRDQIYSMLLISGGTTSYGKCIVHHRLSMTKLPGSRFPVGSCEPHKTGNAALDEGAIIPDRHSSQAITQRGEKN